MSFITIIDKTTEPDDGRHRQVSLSIGKDGKMHLLGVLNHNTEIEFPPESICALNAHYRSDVVVVTTDHFNQLESVAVSRTALVKACKVAMREYYEHGRLTTPTAELIEAAIAKATV